MGQLTEGARSSIDLKSPNAQFLERGGFLYLDGTSSVLAGDEEEQTPLTVVGANSLCKATGGHQLKFQPPQPWRRQYTRNLAAHARFRRVTDTVLRTAGARFYCWIRPDEELHATVQPGMTRREARRRKVNGISERDLVGAASHAQQTADEDPAITLGLEGTEEEDRAAAKMQAVHRGKKGRAQVAELKRQNSQPLNTWVPSQIDGAFVYLFGDNPLDDRCADPRDCFFAIDGAAVTEANAADASSSVLTSRAVTGALGNDNREPDVQEIREMGWSLENSYVGVHERTEFERNGPDCFHQGKRTSLTIDLRAPPPGEVMRIQARNVSIRKAVAGDVVVEDSGDPYALYEDDAEFDFLAQSPRAAREAAEAAALADAARELKEMQQAEKALEAAKATGDVEAIEVAQAIFDQEKAEAEEAEGVEAEEWVGVLRFECELLTELGGSFVCSAKLPALLPSQAYRPFLRLPTQRQDEVGGGGAARFFCKVEELH